ncbi:DegT/DnrJ/EryC1/StrS family aminotransferase [Phytoactinopolyspora mesophila]|uniref:Aminotransferase n=1 Tax=Phytoactinopolyspora mesophila TaxID=2650750 RepID=A0A7K3M001_9ACTN|nr:DegT/DnrJ/EryC1/StrS family aminotransferase [Phytoactinopolyspora mesophila]NDL56621.1 aminotransferase [Phytoactinopolyspora mesophila]
MYRYGDEEVQAVERVIRSGNWFRYGEIGSGKLTETEAFERELANVVGSSYACFTTSGTAALMCCYAGLGLGPGDEVIVPGYTFMATALAPLHLGVIPIVVDVDDSLTLDPEAVERAITPRTRAISPVHMNGLMSDMDRLEQIAAENDLLIIEDSCQCDGGYWHGGRRAGGIGHTGAYSFNLFKMISCGEGGAFLTSDQRVFEQALVYHDAWAYRRPYKGDLNVGLFEGIDLFAGINLRGNEIMAAMMRVQLARLDEIIDDLHRNRSVISEKIEGVVEQISYNGGSQAGTGSAMGLKFDDERRAREFCEVLKEEIGTPQAIAHLPIDQDKHVYTSWDPLLNRRGSYVRSSDPFFHALNDNAPSYHADMLPRTLETLARTVILAINPDWDERACEGISDSVRKAAERTL